MTIFRRRVRVRPIRLFLVAMLAVPLVSLVALWGFAASITITPALKDANYTANTKTTNAGVYPLSSALPQERAETYLYLLSGRQSGRPALLAARQQLDKAIPGAKAAFLASQTSSSTAVLNTLITDLSQTRQRPQLRRFRSAEPVGRLPEVQRYRRRRIPLLPHDGPEPGRPLARRHLGRRRRRGLRAGHGRPRGRDHRRRVCRRRPADPRHPAAVRRQPRRSGMRSSPRPRRW